MSKHATVTPPIFVINLPKDTDRRAFMENQLNRLSLQYKIIEGRYGKDNDVILACDDVLAVKEHGKVLTTGEKGCAFSHRSIYEVMEKEHIPQAIILEDDVVLPENFVTIISNIIDKRYMFDWLSFDYPKIGAPFVKAWSIASYKMIKKNKLFFFYALIKFPLIIMMSLFELVRNVIAVHLSWYRGPKIFYRPLYNAGAYMITLEGVKKLKPLLYPLRFSADRTPNYARMKKNFIMRWYVPRIVHQTDEDKGNTFTSNTIY